VTSPTILSKFRDLHALVVGDICLDRWCQYDPALSEPSRETGIRRLAVVSTITTPGAGGTVASNLMALGAGRVDVLGIRGDDGHGYELARALAARGIGSRWLISSPLVPTFTYTKLLNSTSGEEDQPRIDFVNPHDMPAEVDAAILAALDEAVPHFDVILVADQAETDRGGVVTPSVRARLAALAAAHPDKVFWVDSRERPELFRGMIVKPNDDEASRACHRLFGSEDLPRLRAAIDAPILMVTRGPNGVDAFTPGAFRHIPTLPVENPVDICGAGDSFSAAAALAYAVTRSVDDAARFGNAAASITIMKKGTATASAEEMAAALERVLL
jgi:rfaE bifunctional protein kinase chain/domain